MGHILRRMNQIYTLVICAFVAAYDIAMVITCLS